MFTSAFRHFFIGLNNEVRIQCSIGLPSLCIHVLLITAGEIDLVLLELLLSGAVFLQSFSTKALAIWYDLFSEHLVLLRRWCSFRQ